MLSHISVRGALSAQAKQGRVASALEPQFGKQPGGSAAAGGNVTEATRTRSGTLIIVDGGKVAALTLGFSAQISGYLTTDFALSEDHAGGMLVTFI